LIGILKSKLVEKSDVLFKMNNGIVTYVNPYSYLKLRKNIKLDSIDFITSDGIVIKILSRFFLKRSVQRLSPDFSSYFKELFLDAVSKKSTVFLIGAKPELIDTSVQNIKNKFPLLNIVGYRHGFFENEIDMDDQVLEMTFLNPDLVIVGMGAPLQEKYLIKLKESNWNGNGYACGGFLHQTNKSVEYYPEWMNKMNLRWLYRIYCEPKLIRRYTVDYFWFLLVFFFDLIRYKFKKS